jgi:FADH2 O2-dependent halogenase
VSRVYDVAIIGSGIGGTLLARTLRTQGRSIALIERHRHPRFAIGESSTPLASLSLERLAEKYGLHDLAQVATYGRWLRHYPRIQRGLKRGFTFYDHRNGDPRVGERAILQVAASPNEIVSDSHWLRSDFDHHQIRRAGTEGVDIMEGSEVSAMQFDTDRVELHLASEDKTKTIVHARVVVDATGSTGIVGQLLGVPEDPTLETRSSLVFGHFRHVVGLSAEALDRSAQPYPAQWAAVHHLIDEGWIYELRFDDGLVSAGALLRKQPEGDPAAIWRELIASYPVLAQSFGGAKAVTPIRLVPRIQHRMAQSSGSRWVALPHAYGFVDPLFSTGIAWSLRSVERLAELLGDPANDDACADGSAFRLYDELLQLELNQLDSLVAGAYHAMQLGFEYFAAYSMVYFTAASWTEARQRLLAPESAAWEAFLGADDPILGGLVADARAALPSTAGCTTPAASEDYWRWIAEHCAERDLVGLDRWGPTLTIPVDLDILIERCHLLGLDQESVKPLLPRLRGDIESI